MIANASFSTKTIRTVLLIIGLVLVIDCGALMIFGKIDFGTLLPFLIGCIFLIHAIFWRFISALLQQQKWLSQIWKILWALFAIWLLSFIIFAISLQHKISQSQSTQQPVDAILVLGGGLIDGKPTPALAKRLDTAAPVIKQQTDTLVITSGGIGARETRSEADVMAHYLQEQYDIPLSRVFQEGRSTSTEENFLFSAPILEKHGITKNNPILVVTSDFHIPRSEAIARHQGYTQTIMLASPTPLKTRYNAWFREYFAYISGWLLNEY